MVDHVGAPGSDDWLDGIDRDVEPLESRARGQVVLATGRQVVDDQDLPAVSDQPIDEMTADEPGATGHDGAPGRGPGSDPARQPGNSQWRRSNLSAALSSWLYEPP